MFLQIVICIVKYLLISASKASGRLQPTAARARSARVAQLFLSMNSSDKMEQQPPNCHDLNP